jgi:hypothetical protein
MKDNGGGVRRQSRHCERSEAIQRDVSSAAPFPSMALDCFASLAMTLVLSYPPMRILAFIPLLLLATPAAAQTPDFARLVTEQFEKCATVGPNQTPRSALFRVELDRRGRVVGEPEVVGAGSDEASTAFERAMRERLKSCAPYRIARTHPGAFAQWRRIEVTAVSGLLRRDQGWSGGRRLSGGAAERVPIVMTRAQDYAQMGAFTTIGGDCTAVAQGRITIERQARVGAVRHFIGPSPSSFAPGHRLAHCNGKLVDGTIVRYDRRGRTPGKDSFRFVVRFENGEVRVIEADVTMQ